MSERYSNVFTLPQNLYTVGSPVVIAAGTLLKDNQNGKIVAQLKFRSISNKTIKAVKVKLDLLDTARAPLGKIVTYDYLDLSAVRDDEFGQKVPVFVPDNKVRAYTVSVTEVVFDDLSAWKATDECWQPLNRQKTLGAVFSDEELVKQYQIAVGSKFPYYPMVEKDLWYCACGALNHEGEACHSCYRTLFELQTISIEQLTNDKDDRLAQEAIAAKEKAAAEKAAADKIGKILKIVIPVFCTVVATALLVTKVIIPNSKYNDAVALMEVGQYEEAIAAFEAMDGYKDSAEQIENCENAIKAAEQARIEAEKAEAYANAEKLADNGEIAKAAMAFANLGDYQDSRERSFAIWKQVINENTIAASYSHTVGLKQDGTVVAIGNTKAGRCDVSHWRNIVAINSINMHTVGLNADGTVVAVGANDEGQCDVSGWKDIVAIATGAGHTVGLKNDGTVVAVGYDDDGRCDVSDWTNVMGIAAGYYYTMGLKTDGTVIAVGANDKGQCNVSNWRNITDIVGSFHTVGLKSDGTVIAVGANNEGQCNVSGWSDIVAISVGAYHTVGLKSDGTVIAVGANNKGQCDVSGWKDIVAISAGAYHTVGLKSDGTVVVIGWDEFGQCNVSSWTNIKLP